MTNEKKPSRDGQATMSAAERHADVRSEAAFFATMPNGFTEAFQAALDWRGVSQAQLARTIHILEDTISRIINQKTKGGLHNMVLMCVGAQLPFLVSSYLLERGGYGFRPGNMDDHWYAYVLMYKYADPVDEVNAFLREQGATPLF